MNNSYVIPGKPTPKFLYCSCNDPTRYFKSAASLSQLSYNWLIPSMKTSEFFTRSSRFWLINKGVGRETVKALNSNFAFLFGCLVIVSVVLDLAWNLYPSFCLHYIGPNSSVIVAPNWKEGWESRSIMERRKKHSNKYMTISAMTINNVSSSPFYLSKLSIHWCCR